MPKQSDVKETGSSSESGRKHGLTRRLALHTTPLLLMTLPDTLKNWLPNTFKPPWNWRRIGCSI